MGATLTTVNGMLKEVYEGDLRDQLQSDEVSTRRIEKSSDGVFDGAGGKYVVFPVRYGRNHGISYRADGGALASAGQQAVAQAQESLKYGYGRFEITGPAMELAKTNPQAFLPALELEMDGLKKDISRDRNRIVVGNPLGFSTTSGTGVITRCTSGATSATFTAPLNNQIEVGMVVDAVDTAGTPVAGGTGLTVTAVNASTEASFTLSGSITSVTDQTCIVRTGNWNKEPYGLTHLVSATGTIHNINSATAGNEYWRSTADSSTTTLTEAAMIARCDDIRRKGGGRPSAIFCSLGVRRAYFNLMTSLRRYNEPKEFSGGLIGLAFNYGKEIPVVDDLDMPQKYMMFLDEKEFTIYRNKDWYFDDTTGSVLQWVTGYDKYEGMMKSYWNLVCHKRNAHAVMSNVTEA